jgi:hypothetical protein
MYIFALLSRVLGILLKNLLLFFSPILNYKIVKSREGVDSRMVVAIPVQRNEKACSFLEGDFVVQIVSESRDVPDSLV